MSEFIDVFINGDAEDAFSQFDIALNGEIPFPRREVVFFEYRYGVLLGGIIYLEFSKYLFKKSMFPLQQNYLVERIE